MFLYVTECSGLYFNDFRVSHVPFCFNKDNFMMYLFSPIFDLTLFHNTTELLNAEELINIRSRIQFLMRSVDFFNWHNPSSHLMPPGLTQPVTEMNTRNLLGVKGGQHIRLTTSPPSVR
jgi:hypothetical protein